MKRRSLLQDVDEPRRILRDVVGDRLQLGNDRLLAGRLEPRRIAFREEEVVDELLVLEAVEEAGGAALRQHHDAGSDEGLFRLAIPTAEADVDDHVIVGERLLDAALLRVQELVHRPLVEVEAARHARVVDRALRLGIDELAGGIHVAAAEEIVLRVLRLAAYLGTDRVVVHERRRRPDVEQRNVAVVAAAVVLVSVALGNVRDHGPAAQGLRAVFGIQMARDMIGVQRAAAERAHFVRRRGRVVAEEILAHLARMVFRHGVEIPGLERVGRSVREARMAPRAVFGEEHPAPSHRIRAEFAIEIGDQVLARVVAGRGCRWPCARDRERRRDPSRRPRRK